MVLRGSCEPWGNGKRYFMGYRWRRLLWFVLGFDGKGLNESTWDPLAELLLVLGSVSFQSCLDLLFGGRPVSEAIFVHLRLGFLVGGLLVFTAGDGPIRHAVPRTGGASRDSGRLGNVSPVQHEDGDIVAEIGIWARREG